MSYYHVYYRGDGYGEPVEIGSEKVWTDKDGRYFHDLFDIESGAVYGKEEVYTSKKDAWKSILAHIDKHLEDMQKKRDEMWTRAIEDGYGRLSKEDSLKYIETLKAQEK